jgi:hypothetical protein
MDPSLGKMLVAQLKLCNRGCLYSAAHGHALSRTYKKYQWQHLVSFLATEGNSNDWARLNPTHDEHDNSSIQHVWQQLEYFSLQHTQSLEMPHPTALMHTGLCIPDTDGNIRECQRYGNKQKKITLKFVNTLLRPRQVIIRVILKKVLTSLGALSII